MNQQKKGFLASFPEKAEHNQYWYSSFTIQKVVEELIQAGGKIAFLSTPSLYFSLPEELRQEAYVFDYDDCWKDDRGYVFYDYQQPLNVDNKFQGYFDMIVIDPPFITEDVWRKYGETAKHLIKNDGKYVLSTVIENEKLLFELFQVKPTVFQPSIPNLVYQYNFFTNYEPTVLNQLNPEIPI